MQAQVDAYNAHDVEAFLACYAVDAEVRTPEGHVVMRGHDEMRQRYGTLFAQHPDLRAEVPTRIRAGDWTVDEEVVDLGGEQLHVAVAYRVQDGLIRTAVVFRSDPAPAEQG